MSTSYRTLMSSAEERSSFADGQEFVSDNGDTQFQSNKEPVKLFGGAEGLVKKFLFPRRHNLNLELPSSSILLSSYEKLTLESIRNWDTTRGKRALLCGVTYNRQKYKLKGANWDVISMRELLISRFGFPSSCIRILAELDAYPHPTNRNLQEALIWLVKNNQPGDSLVFYFSGHGLRIPNLYNGFNKSICPTDFKTAGVIADNEINDIIVRPLKTGVRLHAIIDASHSGTILDLPNVYSLKENRWLDNSSAFGVYKGTIGGHAISISACEDNQLAAETSAFSNTGRQMEGAMTYTFRKALSENSRLTYASLLASMHANIMATYKEKHLCLRGMFHRVRLQEPLLSSSKVFDPHEPFVL